MPRLGNTTSGDSRSPHFDPEELAALTAAQIDGDNEVLIAVTRISLEVDGQRWGIIRKGGDLIEALGLFSSLFTDNMSVHLRAAGD